MSADVSWLFRLGEEGCVLLASRGEGPRMLVITLQRSEPPPTKLHRAHLSIGQRLRNPVLEPHWKIRAVPALSSSLAWPVTSMTEIPGYKTKYELPPDDCLYLKLKLLCHHDFNWFVLQAKTQARGRALVRIRSNRRASSSWVLGWWLPDWGLES